MPGREEEDKGADCCEFLRAAWRAEQSPCFSMKQFYARVFHHLSLAIKGLCKGMRLCCGNYFETAGVAERFLLSSDPEQALDEHRLPHRVSAV